MVPKQGQLKGTPRRRAEFLDYLRSLGSDDECVYWPWSEERKDYLKVYINGHKVLVHRWVYEQINGPLPERANPTEPGATGVVVRHTCDVRACVRPSHLITGSQAENIHDAVERGRMRGNTHAIGFVKKLTDENVAEIRRLHVSGKRQADIARSFAVSPSTVSQIVHWKKRTGPRDYRLPESYRSRAKLGPREVEQIRRMVGLGVRQKLAAEVYGVTPAAVSRIVHGKTWVKSREGASDMTLTKKEQEALAEEQRRQNTSVTDLAREEGMTGHMPGGGEVPKEKSKEPDAEEAK